MTEQELLDLIAQGESQNLEFKDERFKPSSLAETFVGAIRKEQDEYRPTIAGMLIFGKQPQKFLPQSEVVVVRYPGEEVTRNLRDSREFSGTIPQMIERIMDYISEHIQVASVRGELHQRGRREDIPDYPLPALREIIINAIAHREYQIRGSRVIVKWFTDHIQVWSPGGFLEPITPETIYAAGPFHRNPDLMKALYGYGYVEAYGDGMHLIKEQCEKHPLKPPLPGFREAPGGVFTTVYAADLSKVLNYEKKENGAEAGLNERQIQALTYLGNNSSLSKRKFMELNRVSDKTAYLELSDMVRKEILVREGKGRAVVYRMKAGIE